MVEPYSDTSYGLTDGSTDLVYRFSYIKFTHAFKHRQAGNSDCRDDRSLRDIKVFAQKTGVLMIFGAICFL